METNELKSPTDQLKLKIIQRTLLMIFGSVLACVLLTVIPVLLFAPARAESFSSITTSSGPADVGLEPIPMSNAFPFAALIPPITLLVLLGLLAYGIYDVIRLFMQYRKRKEMDEVMFP